MQLRSTKQTRRGARAPAARYAPSSSWSICTRVVRACRQARANTRHPQVHRRQSNAARALSYASLNCALSASCFSCISIDTCSAGGCSGAGGCSAASSSAAGATSGAGGCAATASDVSKMSEACVGESGGEPQSVLDIVRRRYDSLGSASRSGDESRNAAEAHFSSAVLSGCDMRSSLMACVAPLTSRQARVPHLPAEPACCDACAPRAEAQPEQRKRHAARISGSPACG